MTMEQFDCFEAAVIGESEVGITIRVYNQEGAWLSWEETVKFHAWISKLIDAAKF